MVNDHSDSERGNPLPSQNVLKTPRFCLIVGSRINKLQWIFSLFSYIINILLLNASRFQGLFIKDVCQGHGIINNVGHFIHDRFFVTLFLHFIKLVISSKNHA